MNGERKTPTRMFTPRLNQLEPTFLIISRLRIVLSPVAGSSFLLRSVERVLGDQLVPRRGHHVAPGRFNLPSASLGQRGSPAADFSRSDKRNILSASLGCDPLVLFQLLQFPHPISGT